MEKLRYYAGIGSRTAPEDDLKMMRLLGSHYAKRGWVLRSGGAPGSDKAFEEGCDKAGGRKEIFIPKECTEEAINLASTILAPEHWANCSEYARNCHGRNCMQVLGRDLKTPVEYVICWTPNGEPIGGTRTAIMLAIREGIRVINLGAEATKAEAIDLLKFITFIEL